MYFYMSSFVLVKLKVFFIRVYTVSYTSVNIQYVKVLFDYDMSI